MGNTSHHIANFIVVGDIHWRGVSPRGRLDSIQEALTTKLREVFALAEKYSALAILQAGDMTDSPGISLSTLADLIDVLREAPCPVLSVPGNHDIWGANATSLPRTPFGLLDRAEYIENVAYMPYVFPRALGNEDRDLVIVGGGKMPLFMPFEIAITGHGYDAKTDIDKNQYCYTGAVPGLKDSGNYFNIHIAHGMLLERAPGHDMRHTILAEIPMLPKPPQVLICGHDHAGFGIKQVGETLCINPGALCRLSASAAEMERPVQIALLEVAESGQARAELIPLQSAKPGHEVLSREHLNEAARREEQMNSFLELLAGEGEIKFLETREIIDGIAKREKLPVAVVDEALTRLARAREELNTTH